MDSGHVCVMPTPRESQCNYSNDIKIYKIIWRVLYIYSITYEIEIDINI